MFEEEFRKRLLELRQLKKVSARDMSLSIGQNPNYINIIETGKAMPSMLVFFSICDYLKVSPAEFFETKTKNPERMRLMLSDLQKLSQHNFENIADITHSLAMI